MVRVMFSPLITHSTRHLTLGLFDIQLRIHGGHRGLGSGLASSKQLQLEAEFSDNRKNISTFHG